MFPSRPVNQLTPTLNSTTIGTNTSDDHKTPNYMDMGLSSVESEISDVTKLSKIK